MEAPSVDLFAIDLTDEEFRLEFDDKFTGTIALGCRWSCVVFVAETTATVASDLSFIDDVIVCNLGNTFEFDTFRFDVESVD